MPQTAVRGLAKDMALKDISASYNVVTWELVKYVSSMIEENTVQIANSMNIPISHFVTLILSQVLP